MFFTRHIKDIAQLKKPRLNTVAFFIPPGVWFSEMGTIFPDLGLIVLRMGCGSDSLATFQLEDPDTLVFGLINRIILLGGDLF